MKNAIPLSTLSDRELQERIDRFSRQMLEADERFRQRAYALEDRAERDRCWIDRRSLMHERARRQRVGEVMEQAE